LRATFLIRYASWDDTAAGARVLAASQVHVLHHHFVGERAIMTAPLDHPQDDPQAVPSQDPHEVALPDAMETAQAVQQLRAAGFSDDQQAALTTALLRVLAVWTQQATRDDVQAGLHAGEQRLTQRLDTLQAELRREIAQHVDTVHEELRCAVAQQADLVRALRATPARRWGWPWWLMTALLGLTCAGVLLLVVHHVLGW
jgi:hypothetical protein